MTRGSSGMNVFLFRLYDGDVSVEMELLVFFSAEIAVLLLDTSVVYLEHGRSLSVLR